MSVGQCLMPEPIAALCINSARLRADFEALAEIGSTGDGGVHRPTFSAAHLAARAWLRAQIAKAGLDCRVDGAGNHSARLTRASEGAPTLLLGSHLDSVPYGGRFDGPLGVLAALEVLRVAQENHLSLGMNLEAIDFTDEEGTLVGFLGSGALAGHLTPEQLASPRGGREALQAGMARAEVTEGGIFASGRATESLGGYLELHIEQGKRLIDRGIPIGIVSDIVGIYSYRLTFLGQANHAGTTSMQDRRDAAQGASAFTLAVRETVQRDFPIAVANVGNMSFSPGVFNIVPERVVVALEFRAADESTLQSMEKVLIEQAHRDAARFELTVHVERVSTHAPTPMSEKPQQAFAEACDALGLAHIPLVSGAGHDAQSLASVCRVGMIFVPSVGGVSHSPHEFTEWQDCVNGANVLLAAALRMAAG